MITYSLIFLPQIFGLVRLLGIFFLPWEEVLCDGFDLTVHGPSERRETDTYVSLLLRITRWGLFLHK